MPPECAATGNPSSTHLRPERVVVVLAVDGQVVEPEDLVRQLRVLPGDPGNGPFHVGRDHRHLEAQRMGVLQLADALFGGVQRDRRRHGHAVAILGVRRRRVLVVRVADHLAELVVRGGVEPQAHRRIEDRVIEPEVVHALVVELRQHRGAAVERVLRRQRPPGSPDGPRVLALLPVHLVPARRHASPHVGPELVGRVLAARRLDEIHQDGCVFDDVRVAVDQRMIELGADLRGCRRHFSFPQVPSSPECTTEAATRRPAPAALLLPRLDECDPHAICQNHDPTRAGRKK